MGRVGIKETLSQGIRAQPGPSHTVHTLVMGVGGELVMHSGMTLYLNLSTLVTLIEGYSIHPYGKREPPESM